MMSLITPPAVESILHLPVQLSSFVGREAERRTLVDLLREQRLVTLVGAPGIGKTRLALRIGNELASAFADGVWFVELADVADPTTVSDAVSAALGIPERSGVSRAAALAEYLADRQMLLIVDGCEHLTHACAVMSEDLRRTSPHLRILTTSRESLRAEGEVIWRVPPLEVPRASPGVPMTMEAASRLSGFDAVQLFIDRATAAEPSFMLRLNNAPAIVEICRRLEGIPLAIELAAARVSTLSAEQIADRLDNQLALLAHGRRTSRPRQQTLRATLDWSYGLLSAMEQTLLCNLGVFAGGWTVEAVDVVCGNEGEDKHDVVEPLARLIDASLVVRLDLGSVARFRLLEPVRQYAAERLLKSADNVRVRDRHVAYCVALLNEAHAGFRRDAQVASLDQVAIEYDNLRAALRWTLADPNRADLGLQILGLVWWFWWTRGHFAEGRRWLDRGLATSRAAPPSLRAELLYGAGCLAWSQGELDQAEALYRQSLSLRVEFPDRAGMANVLAGLAHVARDRGDYDNAATLFIESLVIFRELDDRAGISDATGDLGYIAHKRGDVDEAEALYQESLAVSREIGDTGNIAWLCCNLGDLIRERGASEKALALYVESLVLRRDLGDRAGIADTLDRVAIVVADHQPSAAARLLGAIDAVRETIGAPTTRSLNFDDPSLAALQPLLDDLHFAEAQAEGQAMSLDRAVQYGLDLANTHQAQDTMPAELAQLRMRSVNDPGATMPLTSREREVASLIAMGQSNREIAAELVVAVRTVHAHVGNILGKLGLSSRTQIALWVRDHDRHAVDR